MNIKSLSVNKYVNQAIYQVRSASFRESENANGYYLMRLGDRTGQIDAIWLNTQDINMKIGDFISVDGKVQNYQGRMQLKISSAHKVDPDLVDINEYSLSAVDEKKLRDKLINYIESIKIKPLYVIVKRLLLVDLYEDFSKAPAATYNHHAYMGGLFEHSLSVADICACFAEIYPAANRDLLIAGALLHDIGKINELEFNESISYSTKGNLLGHIFMGANRFIEECNKEKDFPEYLANHIAHIILSHHGILERGAPVDPRTIEAILVHKADTTDADANAFIVSQDESAGDKWLVSRALNRIIYLESPPEFELR
ncbi:MAG: HD domain-containing protein [Cyanobacteriota bacterium]